MRTFKRRHLRKSFVTFKCLWLRVNWKFKRSASEIVPGKLQLYVEMGPGPQSCGVCLEASSRVIFIFMMRIGFLVLRCKHTPPRTYRGCFARVSFLYFAGQSRNDG